MRVSYQKRILLTAIVMLTAFIFVVAALWFPLVKRDVKIMDAIFVIDITDSMNVKDAELDGENVSRLAWAKEFTRRTLLKMTSGGHGVP